MNRILTLASGTLVTIWAALFWAGCGSDDPEPAPSSGGSSATGGSNSGGSSGSGATTAMGGSSGSSGSGGGTAGSGGAAAGGTAGTGMGGAAGGTAGTAGTTGGVCGTGIRNGITMCTASCTGAVCGLADLGRRDCPCEAGLYQCASCAFTGNEEILQPPAEPLPACAASEAETKGFMCTTKGERCTPEDATRVCACWDTEGALEWDCDSIPWD